MKPAANTKCFCAAYPYPHRKGGGKCQEANPAADRAEGRFPAVSQDAKWNRFFNKETEDDNE